jgi:23S rRNA G2445 N2-methylase RlmL
MHNKTGGAHGRRVPLLARALHGIEDVAAAEIRERLSPTRLRIAHREIRFESTQLEQAVSLGVADDVFMVVFDAGPIGRGRSELATLAGRVRSIDLAAAADVIGTVRPVRGVAFDVTASFLGARNFTRFDIEDAIGDAVESATGWCYRSRGEGRPSQTDLSLRAHLTREATTVAVRVAATPLHRRSYRVVSRPGALHPPLARALLWLASPAENAVLVDPFCGTGTIPIEAKLWRPSLTVFGSDLDQAAITAARTNAATASATIELRRADAAYLPAAGNSVDNLVTNPPWGIRVSAAGSLSRTALPFWANADGILTQAGRIVVTAKKRQPSLSIPERTFAILDRRTVRVSGAIIELLTLGRR